MNVLITGGKTFNNDLVFRRAMGVVMSEMNNDKELNLILTGPYKTNELARQFVNLSENSFKSRGMKIVYSYLNITDINWQNIDSVVALVDPPQKNTVLGYKAEEYGIDVNIFRY